MEMSQKDKSTSTFNRWLKLLPDPGVSVLKMVGVFNFGENHFYYLLKLKCVSRTFLLGVK